MTALLRNELAHGPVGVHVDGLTGLAGSLLGAIQFGSATQAQEAGSACIVPVRLETASGRPEFEAWLTQGDVASGRSGLLRWSASPCHFFGVVEVDEADYGGIERATSVAYEAIVRFQQDSAHPYIWRMWNFIDAINVGAADQERYKQFCNGRLKGIGQRLAGFPAASALGRRDGARIVQVVWLAGQVAARFVENPRQISAWRYPLQYGVTSPSFSRGALLASQLLVSGTASIVGHETLHVGDPALQTRESIANVRAVERASGIDMPGRRAVKAYVRREQDVDLVAKELAEFCLGGAPCLLIADICRSDLLLEIEAITV